MIAVGTRRALDAKGIDAVMAVAEEEATRNGYRVVIAIVDAGGHLLQLRRTEGAQPASGQVAIDKARTAAIFVRPSREIEQQVSSGRLGALALHGAVALTGGIPLTVDDEVIGAIGTSGETPDQDESVSLAGAHTPFSVTDVPALTRDGAQAAAAASAAERAVWPVVAVVDAGGELMHLWRPDLAQVASVQVAADKARTAALYRRPSKDFEDQAAHGRPSALHLAQAVPLQGGMPIVHSGHVVGAVGVSGASSAAEVQELSVLAAEAASATARDGEGKAAAYFPAESVAAKFATGGLLHDTPGYKVDAGRRTAPGEVEYHEHVADIMHVVSGTATVVTGGQMIASRAVGPGEMRADAIEGGTRRELGAGDVLVIPPGVPHHFTAVSDPFLYLVAKVRD